MTDFLKSLKADLTDRRLLPIVALVLVVLVGAVAYATLSGGSSSSSPTTATVTPSTSAAGGLAVVQAEGGPNQAIAETTNGATVQRHGVVHNPFALLPAAAKEAAAAAAKTAASSASSSSCSSAASSSKSGVSTSGGESTPTSSSKPSSPAKHKTIYQVAVQFGPLPAGVLPANAELHSYLALSKPTPLPSSKDKLIEFLGVTVTGSNKSATFLLSGEVILHGEGACLPSATQCRMIDLKAGKSEQLEYLSESGQVTVYVLRVVSIESSNASSASVSSVLRSQARTANRLQGSDGPLRVAGLRFSSQAGVLVFDGHGTFGASARASQRRPRR